jgi:uncharacterized protein YbcV (DUF1398 family)
MGKDMNPSIQKLNDAFQLSMKIRPSVGGFPVLAEVLKQAGVKKNYWSLPSCQSIFVMDSGNVVNQGTPLVMGMNEIFKFDEAALIKALRKDQSGRSSFSEFINEIWNAGVTSYNVNFELRICTYFGVLGESYKEEYAGVDIRDLVENAHA